MITATICRAISRDPDVYPDPEAFKPSRWLSEKGQMREDLKFFNWGFGRRCTSNPVVVSWDSALTHRMPTEFARARM